MKKFMSLVLALVMVCSLSVTAFAADTTTLTARIPNSSGPSYSVEIPADTVLEYGNTEMQRIDGKVTVKDVENLDMIWVRTPYTDLINTEDPTDTITLDLYGEFSAGNTRSISKTGSFNGGTPDIYNSGTTKSMVLFAQVSDWSGATPGAIYQAVITFNFTTD